MEKIQHIQVQLLGYPSKYKELRVQQNTEYRALRLKQKQACAPLKYKGCVYNGLNDEGTTKYFLLEDDIKQQNRQHTKQTEDLIEQERSTVHQLIRALDQCIPGFDTRSLIDYFLHEASETYAKPHIASNSSLKCMGF
jgi:hypothetical protein